jgi:glycosyltransferase involved in cell wall biosynthesis
MSRPLVSVVIPVYNSEATLEECLRSVKNQSYSPIEVIVVESKRSQDRTREIAQEFDCSLYHLHGKERTAATNVGIKMSQGKYVYRVDSDLVLDKNLIEEAVKKCEKEGYDAVSVLCPPDPDISFWAKVRKLEKDCYKYDTFHSGARFFRKDIIREIGYFNENMVLGEDYDFYNRLVSAGFRVGVIEPEEIHLGEPRSLKEIIVKQFYYGKNLREFLMVNKGVGIVQMAPLRKSLLKNWKKFAKQPLLTAGFLFYLFVYYSSSISGFIVAVMKDQ